MSRATLPKLRPEDEAEIDRILAAPEAPTFGEWLRLASPTWHWEWPHLDLLARTLDRVTSGEITKLIVLMPPRHGKSETVTVRYATYRLELNGATRVIQASYNQPLAEKFSRKSRRIARDRNLPLSEERSTAGDWETVAGGGVRAVGFGSGITGHGGDLILLDDPIKNREEAESPTYREKVWAAWTDDISTRREPGAATIVCLTPWHHDDLVGRMLSAPDAATWTVLRLPALADPHDPLGRAEGEALCPERFDATWLQEQRAIMGAYSFEGLYQCHPTPRSGNSFPRGQVQIVGAAPARTLWCRAWDKAGTSGGGKRSAGVKVGRGADGLTYIADVRLGQWDAITRERTIKQTAEEDGVAVRIELEQEPGSGGKESAEATVRMLAGYVVEAHPATGDKMTRADPFAAQWQAGNVRLIKGDWNKPYLDEMEIAPNGKYVDQMDGSAMAFNRLAKVRRPSNVGAVGGEPGSPFTH